MPRINLHGNLAEVKRPNRFGRARILNGQLSLDRTAYASKQSAIETLVRTTLSRQRESKQQSEDWNHTRLGKGELQNSVALDALPWSQSTKDLVRK
jgi:hypothetical protein